VADIREQAAVLALAHATSGPWHRTAALIEAVGSAVRIVERQWDGFEDVDRREAEELVGRLEPKLVDSYRFLIAGLAQSRVRTVTILDEDYPANLRDVFNRPPLLFIKGDLRPDDERAVAVVGTRNPSKRGLDEASRLATDLAHLGVTVLSGLARGIDSAAHRATLQAGGRTIAVMGAGITHRIYPPENDMLAAEIQEHGALVSQFWPDSPPIHYHFPMRNVVMSGMAAGTVVIEAGPTSGAKMQARLALEHGKRLFLVDSLVMAQSWARTYAQHPATVVVRSVSEITETIDRLTRPAKQLSLGS
jgi:DNA processing protein